MRQDKPVNDIMFSIEVQSQATWDLLQMDSRISRVGGKHIRVCLASLASSVMEIAKTVADLNDRIDRLERANEVQADLLNAVREMNRLLEKSQAADNRPADKKFWTVFRNLFWPPSV